MNSEQQETTCVSLSSYLRAIVPVVTQYVACNDSKFLFDFGAFSKSVKHHANSILGLLNSDPGLPNLTVRKY